MSARKAAEDETPAAAGDAPVNLLDLAVGLALEHRAFAAATARAMALGAENALALQQANGELAISATGKSVSRILDGPLPGLIPSSDDTQPDPDTHRGA